MFIDCKYPPITFTTLTITPLVQSDPPLPVAPHLSADPPPPSLQDTLRTAAVAVCLLLSLWWVTPGLACNEAVCASIVSKCMLTGSCKCDMTNLANCTCCKECSECLDNLYEECCYCFSESCS